MEAWAMRRLGRLFILHRWVSHQRHCLLVLISLMFHLCGKTGLAYQSLILLIVVSESINAVVSLFSS